MEAEFGSDAFDVKQHRHWRSCWRLRLRRSEHRVLPGLYRLDLFQKHVIERWQGALMRRSQRRRLTWTRMKTIADRYLPFPRILHPWPEKRFLVTIQGGSPLR